MCGRQQIEQRQRDTLLHRSHVSFSETCVRLSLTRSVLLFVFCACMRACQSVLPASMACLDRYHLQIHSAKTKIHSAQSLGHDLQHLFHFSMLEAFSMCTIFQCQNPCQMVLHARILLSLCNRLLPCHWPPLECHPSSSIMRMIFERWPWRWQQRSHADAALSFALRSAALSFASVPPLSWVLQSVQESWERCRERVKPLLILKSGPSRSK